MAIHWRHTPRRGQPWLHGDDVFFTQRFARHANPITTVAYTHPSEEEIYSAIAGL